MYSLKVLKGFQHEDGRIFEVGHDCSGLDAFEVAELMTDYADSFEAANDVTRDFIANSENLQHLSDAVKRRKSEQGIVGNLKARKQ